VAAGAHRVHPVGGGHLHACDPRFPADWMRPGGDGPEGKQSTGRQCPVQQHPHHGEDPLVVPHREASALDVGGEFHQAEAQWEWLLMQKCKWKSPPPRPLCTAAPLEGMPGEGGGWLRGVPTTSTTPRGPGLGQGWPLARFAQDFALPPIDVHNPPSTWRRSTGSSSSPRSSRRRMIGPSTPMRAPVHSPIRLGHPTRASAGTGAVLPGNYRSDRSSPRSGAPDRAASKSKWVPIRCEARN
jgi:hypothetical protein